MSLLTRIQRTLLETSVLNKKTLTVQQIAHKHGVSVETIQAQLEKGIAVEHEHTSNTATAREIALDHLAELPDYYDRLKKLEEELDLKPNLLPDRGTMPTPFPIIHQHLPNDPRFRDMPLRRVPLHLVRATQRTIDAENVKKFIDDPFLGGRPVVAVHDDGYVIVDGHHRLSAARMRGETYALAHVVEDGAGGGAGGGGAVGGAPANAAGYGNIAGLGVGPKGEPGVHLPRKRKLEEAPDRFAGGDVMDTDMGILMNVREPKRRWERYAKYVGTDEPGETIRVHARKTARDIILRDSKTGTMAWLRKRGWHK